MRKLIARRIAGAAIASLILVASLANGSRAQNTVGTSLDPQNFGQIERGRYLAIVGDCASCHTVPGSNQPFAGGRPIETPFGVVVGPISRPIPRPASAPGLMRCSSALCAKAKGMTVSCSTRRCPIPITPR